MSAESNGTWTLEFSESEQLFLVLKHAGKIAQTIGRVVEGQMKLTIDEGMYMLAAGRAVLADGASAESLAMNVFESGVLSPMAVSEAMMLRNLGFIVCEEGAQLNSVSETRIFAPDERYRKSAPPPHKGAFLTASADAKILCSVPENTLHPLFVALHDMGAQLFARAQWLPAMSAAHFASDDDDPFSFLRHEPKC